MPRMIERVSAVETNAGHEGIGHDTENVSGLSRFIRIDDHLEADRGHGQNKIEFSLYNLFGDGIRGRHLVFSVELSDVDVFAVDISGGGKAVFDPLDGVVEYRLGGTLKNGYPRNALRAGDALMPIGNQQDK